MSPNFALLFLLNANNELLLLRRINTPFCNHCYSLPGGKIEAGETASQALLREAKNSIGLALTLDNIQCIHVMHRKCNEAEFFAAIFKLKRWAGDPENRETERHDDMRWFALDKLPENMVPAHRQMVQEILQKNFYSEHGWI